MPLLSPIVLMSVTAANEPRPGADAAGSTFTLPLVRFSVYGVNGPLPETTLVVPSELLPTKLIADVPSAAPLST